MKKIIFAAIYCLFSVCMSYLHAQTTYLLAQSNGVRATVSYTQVYTSFNASVTVQNYSPNGAQVKMCVDFEGDSNVGCNDFSNGHEFYLSGGSSRSFSYWGHNSDQIVRYTVYQFNVTGGEPTYTTYNQSVPIYQYGYYNGISAPSVYDIAEAERQKELQKQRKLKKDRSIFSNNLSDGKTTINPAESVKTVYYFMVIANDETGGCSNVFTVNRHSDGSWAFFSDIKQKIAGELGLNSSDFWLIGYFESETAALGQQQNTLQQMKDLGFKTVPYSVQNTNLNPANILKTPKKNDNFWGNDSKITPAKTDSTKVNRNFWD